MTQKRLTVDVPAEKERVFLKFFHNSQKNT